jgi:hypothetical protein
LQIKRNIALVILRPELDDDLSVTILACRVTILPCRMKRIHCQHGAPKEVFTLRSKPDDDLRVTILACRVTILACRMKLIARVVRLKKVSIFEMNLTYI